MNALPTVVAFNVREQITLRFVASRPEVVMDELDFEGVEETLHRGIDAPISVKRGWQASGRGGLACREPRRSREPRTA